MEIWNGGQKVSHEAKKQFPFTNLQHSSSPSLPLSPFIKQTILTTLLRFEPTSSPPFNASDNKLNFKIFAQKSLTNTFVGIYDDSQSLTHAQTRVLHLLSNARANGVTQARLAKRLRIDSNKFHYVLRTLECRGLILKHAAIHKKKKKKERGEALECGNSTQSVVTHLAYLRRYAKELASHHRWFGFDVTNPDDDHDDDDVDDEKENADGIVDDVFLMNNKPQIIPNCDLLAKANGKVLVSEIKKELGYCGSRLRRKAWKQMSSKLKVDRLVEKFKAEVNDKTEACLRLLDPITAASANDICKRLRIDQRKNHLRLISLCSIFGLRACTSNGEPVGRSKLEDTGTGAELSCESPRNIGSSYAETPTNLQELAFDPNGEMIPVMKDIQKAQNLIALGGHASKAEVYANGFVLPKNFRAKLLHNFLWDYLHISESRCDALSSEKCVSELTNNPRSSSKLFSLEAAIKALPFELFLRVVGSTKKYEELIEKSKIGLLLSDLSIEKNMCLMDTRATGRLSLVIDILRRLKVTSDRTKLIRVVTDLQSRDGVTNPTAHSHTMDLRPYIEEPISNDASSLNLISHNLRPRIRHDFILCNRDAVNEYWKTLEYCYAAADQKAALYPFPGSVVSEVISAMARVHIKRNHALMHGLTVTVNNQFS
ncbi:hypothetical protein RIF29_14821 [Crotalaria pallida]|uniref:B-block binding subunit of TFIIIC domain-containing protein n=1 Tax=Crotalaria pallida TaxID=3830 RepID=A0AAN9IAM9_CROPI